MSQRHIVIVGGGLAGLSAGCYALASGFRVTIVEHNLALGGVCTAWRRGPYLVDGCIQWLTGGPFTSLYEELGIVPAVPLNTMEEWATVRDARDGSEVKITRDLDRLERELRLIAPEDGEEIERLLQGAERFGELKPGFEPPHELATFGDQVGALWDARGAIGTLVHFRKPLGVWAHDHIKSERLRTLFTSILPPELPAVALLMVLGYLRRGWLSRPEGGSGRFRDALVATFERLGGEAQLHSTVDEILVQNGRATGVRLEDGTILAADAVVLTSSAPETVLRLLGGRHGADATRERMKRWKMFQPIVLATFAVNVPLDATPSMLVVNHLPPFEVGGFTNDRLAVRTYKDDVAFAPASHALVQATLATDYTWWATRGAGYEAAREQVTGVALAQIEAAVPMMRCHVRMTDVSTPLTFWSMTRSWRGAYEGWLPDAGSTFAHVPKTLPDLGGFVMAGQWVEPGGGVPTAILSGRQAAQILCAEDGRPFNPRPPAEARQA